MKKILAIALALVFAVGVFSGCTLVEEDDDNVVLATVNGVAILKKDFNEVYNYYMYMYTNYGYDATTAATYIDGMASDILADLIDQEVLKQKAEAEGYLNYTDEHKKAAQEVIDEDKNAFIDSLVAEYKSALEGQELKGKNDGESDEAYFKRIAEAKYLENLADSGTSVEKMLEEQLLSDAIERYKEDKLKDVTVLEADIIAEYDALAKEQEQELTTNALYVKARSGQSITLSSGATATYKNFAYNRPGYSLVQHILVNFEQADLDKLKAIVNSRDEYDEEIADRTATIEKETDETKKAEEQALLDAAKKARDEYQEQYDLALKEACAKIQAKTDEIYASVKDGDEANFIKVMIEKSEDTGMQTEEAAKAGYLVGPEDGMVTEFSEAAQALEAGKISEPVATYYGYHIIRSMEKLPEGKVAFEDIKDDLTETLTEEKKAEEWSKLINTWTGEAKVKKYENRI